jgi:hypothetical protein
MKSLEVSVSNRVGFQWPCRLLQATGRAFLTLAHDSQPHRLSREKRMAEFIRI